jgi:lysophospholipase L1-like esterase
MSKKILFQGDSITDCGRNRDNPEDTGRGYVHLLACRLEHDTAEDPFRIWNRGISGHRTKDLLARWQQDCLDLHPDVLSLYIGVNNTWRRYDQNDPTPAEVFQTELMDLLDQTFSRTDCSASDSILIEPFVLDVPAGEKAHWMEDLGPKQEIIRQAANHFGMRHLPLQSIFNQACHQAPAAAWAADGVHPTRAGHQLIANAWAEVMNDLFKGRN